MLNVILYTKENCSLCEEAIGILTVLQHGYSFQIEERDIYANDTWLERYQLEIPVIQVNEIQLNGEEINYESVEDLLKRNSRRV